MSTTTAERPSSVTTEGPTLPRSERRNLVGVTALLHERTPDEQVTDPVKLVDLYLRLSIAADGADSLERQEEDGRAWAAREGLIVRRVWRDAGRSGYRNVKRAGFDAAMADLLAGEVKTLFVWKLDRLSRKGAGQVGTLMDDLARTGGRIHFYKDGLDTSNESARMLIILVSEQARAESANTSLRVRDRKAKERAKGRYLGGPPPYGYQVDEDRHFRPIEPEYSIMREAVERVLDGDSLWTIVRDFNSRGLPTGRTCAYMRKHDGTLPESPSLWRVNTLSAALRSPGLVGLMPEKTRNEDGSWVSKVEAWRDPVTGETVSLMAEGFDPIATEGEQARLLAIMDARLRRYGRGLRPVRRPACLLGGLLYCATCHKAAHTFGNSYRCRRWGAKGNEECSARLCVSINAVDDAVKRAWAGHLSSLEPDDPALQTIADRWLLKYKPNDLRDRAELAEQIEDAQASLNRADDDYYVRGTLSGERHARITAAIGDRIDALRARLAELPEPHADLSPLLDPELSLPALNGASIPEARDLLRLALVRVECSPAPKRGSRFNPNERLRYTWVGDER
ncbi:MAG TPA: recombinase family protein [Marmoricola sp.]|nr:recombinase family protein [Marmoricola sp.]